jgi:hypothetical protein
MSRGLSFGLLSAFFLLLVGWGEAHAQMGERFHIRTLSIEPLKGSRKEAKGIEEKFREALNRTFRLKVVPLGDRDKADGLITGSLRASGNALVVSVELRETTFHLPVATEVIRIEGSGDEEIEAGLMRLARALASRLPSKGEVTQVNEGQIGIDAGGLLGVPEEGVLSIFRIKGVVRHPFTQEIVEYQKVPVAEARVTSVGEETAGARVVRSSLPVQKGDLVTFEVSREIANLYRIRRSHTLPRLPDGLPPKGSAPGKRGERVALPPGHDSGRGWAQVEWVYLKNRYHFGSSGLNFTRNVDFFPGVQADLGYWIWSRLGVEAFYQVGWIRFDNQAGIATVYARPSWIVPQIVVRPPSIGPVQLKASLGYSVYSFSYIHGDRTFFVDSRMSGPLLRMDLWGRSPTGFLGRLVGTFEPFQRVSEHPVDSGSSGRGTGYSLEARGGWVLTDHLKLEIGYRFQRYRYVFGGAGSRSSGVSDAVASEQYSGPLVAFRFEF